MNRCIIFLICSICLIQCVKNKDRANTWIRINDFRNPEIIRFYPDYFVFISPYSGKESKDKFFYTKDSLFLNDIEKYKFKIINENLKIYYNEMHDRYERYQEKNLVNYFNRKFLTTITLPYLTNIDVCMYDRPDPNVFFLDYKNENFKLFYNNKFISPLDSSLYKIILAGTTKDKFERALTLNLCVCEKEVPYKYVRELKKELVKASLFRIKYITSDENDILYEMVFRLPPLKEDLPARKQSHHFSFEIHDNKVLHNGSDISVEQLVEKLINNIRSYPEAICEFYTDDNVSYGYYLYLLSSIRNAYYKVRNEYAEKKYGTVDYRSLDDDIIASIQEQIPMNFLELWHRQ